MGIRSTPVIVVMLWLIWGTAFFAIKIGVSHADPETFALLRVLSAAVVLTAVVVATSRDLRAAFGDRKLHRFGLLLGLTNTAGFLLFQNAGVALAQLGFAVVLIYTQPFLVALGARVLFGQRLSVRQGIGLTVGWLGVILVVAGEIGVGLTPLAAVPVLLAAALFWAAGTLIAARLPSDVAVWPLLMWQNLCGLVPIGVVALIAGGPVIWSGTLVAAAVWAGVAGSVVGFGLQYVLLRRGKAGVVSAWIFAVPIIASALGVLFLGDQVHAGLFLGGAAVALGIVLVSWRSTTTEESRWSSTGGDGSRGRG